MMRSTPFLACLLVISFAALVNGLKLQGHNEAAQAAVLREDIAEIKAEIEILQADWYRLNHPARLQVLATKNLKLQKPSPRQIFALEDGGFAQALVSLELAQVATAGVDEDGRPYVSFLPTFSAVPARRPYYLSAATPPFPEAPSLPGVPF